MGNRLSKIYTRTGDDGSTGMADGSRLPKDELLVQAIGDIDELNAQLGVLACYLDGEALETVRTIQNELFNIGGELTMGEMLPETARLGEAVVQQLEQWLDDSNRSLPPLKEFILPGGSKAAAHAHLARTICRRAERQLVSLNRQSTLNRALLAYVNRLSDYLFVLARTKNEREIFWQSRKAMNNEQ